jgi:uncharacterized OB-fold protein
VSEGVPIHACARCGHEVFPPRLLCSRCGASEWRRREASEGVLEESTVLRRAPGVPALDPVHLGSVRMGGAVVVVARVESGVEEGAPVRLQYRDGIPVAQPKEP